MIKMLYISIVPTALNFSGGLQIPRIEIRGYKINRAYGSTIKNRMNSVFQAFFTTKPTGQACPPLFIRRSTGLGLSLSYDIVKAHSGELRVETKEGEGSTFTIQLQSV